MDRRYVTAALMLVMGLASMEQTVTSTVMPTIILDLKGFEHYSWVAAIYLLALTVSMPLYGRLADVLGRKRVILFAIALFSISSVAASMSRNMTTLIVCRGFQGLGAGGIMPVVLTILGDIFTLLERARIQGLFSFVWGGAALVGPPLGSLLVQTIGWRSVFYVNLPFGLLAMAVLMWKYRDQEETHPTDLDLTGVITLALGSVGLLAVASMLESGGNNNWLVAATAIASAVLIVGFVVNERRAAHPIMPPELMMRRAIGPAMVGMGLMGVALFGFETYVPLYMQAGRGTGAGGAAMAITPVFLTWSIAAFLAPRMMLRWGFRWTGTLGAVFIVASFLGLLICAIAGAPLWLIVAVLSITGLGFGWASFSYIVAAQEAVSFKHRGVVTANLQFFRTLGGALGIGLLWTLFKVDAGPQMQRLEALGITPAKVLSGRSDSALSGEHATEIARMIGHGSIWIFAGMLVVAVLAVGATMLMPTKTADRKVTAAEAMEGMG